VLSARSFCVGQEMGLRLLPLFLVRSCAARCASSPELARGRRREVLPRFARQRISRKQHVPNGKGDIVRRIGLLASVAWVLFQVAAADAQIALGTTPPVPLDASPGGGSQALIPDVPTYYWYNGCGPTALGMIIGYWDAHGAPNLIPGSNDWTTNQSAIQNMIASPGHIRDYVPTPDRVATPQDPYHADDCVADFCGASRAPWGYGWSGFEAQATGLWGYAEHCGYNQYTVSQDYYGVDGSALWNEVTAAIDAGHPLELLVDSNGDAATDHFVTVVGYDVVSGQKRYGCRDTWVSSGTNIRWEDFGPLTFGKEWGVYGATFFSLPVPEPSTIAGLGVLAAVLVIYHGWRRFRRRA
jgi:hypothetical protein